MIPVAHKPPPFFIYYNSIFAAIIPLCPACGQDLTHLEFTSSMQHLLYTCTITQIRQHGDVMCTNLGLRLMAHGPD